MFETLPSTVLQHYYDNSEVDPSKFTPPTIWPAKPSSFPRKHPNLTISTTGEPSYTTAGGATHKLHSISVPAVTNKPPSPDSPTWPSDPTSPTSPHIDEYGDMMVSSLAVSQAVWATSNFFNPYDLLVGPVALVRMKALRERRKICQTHNLMPDTSMRDEAEVQRLTRMYKGIDKGFEEYGVGGRGIVLDWFN